MKSSAAGLPTHPGTTQVAVCPKCRKAIHAAQSEAWCVGCGTPLGEEIASLLPKVVEIRAAAALELARGQPQLTLSGGERIFRGMVGMGTVFGLVGAGFVGALAANGLLFSPEPIDRDEILFMMVAPVGWFGIAFGLGMLYAGLLAILARGRSFRELSIVRAAAAGVAVGLIPAGIVIATEGKVDADAVNALMLFPPLSMAVATVTLLIARRAKPEPMPTE